MATGATLCSRRSMRHAAVRPESPAKPAPARRGLGLRSQFAAGHIRAQSNSHGKPSSPSPPPESPGSPLLSFPLALPCQTETRLHGRRDERLRGGSAARDRKSLGSAELEGPCGRTGRHCGESCGRASGFPIPEDRWRNSSRNLRAYPQRRKKLISDFLSSLHNACLKFKQFLPAAGLERRIVVIRKDLHEFFISILRS